MRCEDEESNLCRRVLRQLLDQNRERLTECQEWQDGVWGDWEDLEPCRSLGGRCGASTGLHTGFKAVLSTLIGRGLFPGVVGAISLVP